MANFPTSKQTFAAETTGTPVIWSKQNPVYETVEALQDGVGYSGDLASDSGSQEARIKQIFSIGSHSQATVASSGTVTLPKTRVAVVTGTTTITSLTATGNDIGRFVILRVTGACQITDGSNIDIAGNFTGPGRLLLVCDGTNWIELGRSPGGSNGHAVIVSGNAMPNQPNLGFSTAFVGNNNTGTSTTEVAPNFGTAAGTIAQGNDSRLSDARTPTAHAASHITGGSDVISVFGVGQRGLVPGPTVASGSKVLADNGNWILPSEAGLPTIYDQNGNPLTTRSQIQVVGEMANATDDGDDTTLLHFRFGKHSTTTLTATGTLPNLPTDGNVVTVTGNTNIANIPGPLTGYEFRIVFLYFTGTPTVQDGVGNIQLNGNFVASNGAMLGLFHDSANWVEVCRSHTSGGGGGTDAESLQGTDIDASLAPNDGDVLAWNDGASQWESVAPSGLSNSLYPLVITPYAIPELADFTWSNQGSATAIEFNDSIFMTAPASGSTDLKILRQALAGSTFVARCGIVATCIRSTQFQSFGIILLNTVDGKAQSFGMWYEGGVWRVQTTNWTDVNTFSASNNVEGVGLLGPLVFFEVAHNGSNRVYRFSNGVQWVQWVSTTLTDFVTPNAIGFYCASNSSSKPIDISVVHWDNV